MFVYQDGRKVCAIHPDTPITKRPVRFKKGWRAADGCETCDKLVEELRKTNVTKDRYIK
ncbi:hypothetical protein GCM10018783_73980 [Streptomyces griseosporeus]|nr:hypothetical protein GCM10018783_73980 [Streptomyces griseosporeus]